MALRNKNENKEKEKLSNQQSYILRGYSSVDDSSDIEDTSLNDEDIDKSPLESKEGSDDDSDEVDLDYSAGSGIQPIWILYEGQIIWAASRYGFRMGAKEYFRIRIQVLLDFLKEKFPEKSYEDLLLSLQGFFVKNNTGDENSDTGYWLESLKNAGIIYGNDGKIMSIGDFRVGKGQGKNREDLKNSLPENLEYILIEHILSQNKYYHNNPLAKKNCKSELTEVLVKDINDFCDELNELCQSFENDGYSNENEARGIGLKMIKFSYDGNTVQKRRLEGWREWWSRKQPIM